MFFLMRPYFQLKPTTRPWGARLRLLGKTYRLEEHVDVIEQCKEMENRGEMLKCYEAMAQQCKEIKDEIGKLQQAQATQQKVGDSKEPVRKGVRALFQEICSLFPPTKLFVFVVDGLKSKNARQRAECLEELGILIQNNGMIVCGPQPQKTVPTLAAQISDRDNAVRSAALNTMVIVYGNVGEAVYKFTSQLSEKDVSLLEERIRRSGKRYAPASAPPSTAQPKDKDQEKQEEAKQKSASAAGTKPEQPEKTPPPKPVEGEGQVGMVEEKTPPEPPPSAPEPKRPGSIQGPFKMAFDFAGMYRRMDARTERVRGYENELNKKQLSLEQVATMEKQPIKRPELVSKYLRPSYSLSLSPTRMASTSAALSYIISQISSNDRETCTRAIRQIEATMVNPSQRPAMTSHVDQLIRALLMQMRLNFSTPLSNTEDAKALQEVMKLGKLLTSCLYTLFNEPSLASLASKDSLAELVKDLLTYLVDERMLKLEDAPQLFRTFNSLMFKICDDGDKTAVWGCMIHGLLRSINPDGSESSITGMLMKCLWKLTRQIPETVTSLKLEQLLLDVHQFMMGYEEVVPAPSPEDYPYRTVKTVLYHLTNTVGPDILSHMTLVKDPESSKTSVYIKKLLAKNQKTGSSAGSKSSKMSNGNASSSSSSLGRGVGSDSVSGPTSTQEAQRLRGKFDRMTKTLGKLPPGSARILSEIFKKIGDPATTNQGLMELYQFKEKYPSYDLEGLLAEQTNFYRDYITKGLRSIKEGKTPRSEVEEHVEELQRVKEMACSVFGLTMEEVAAGVRSSPSPTGRISPTKSDENTPLNKPARDQTSPKPKSAPAVIPPSGTAGGGAGPSSSVNLADLRRRLDKLKGLS